MHLSSFIVLALGLLTNVGARALLDDNSTVNVNAAASADLTLDPSFSSIAYDADDEYDEYSKRSSAILADAAATDSIEACLDIIGQFNTSAQPYMVGIQSVIEQLQSDGQGDPMSLIMPQLSSIMDLTQQATAQVQAVPVSATPDDSDDGPSLSDSLDLVKSILDLVSSIIGLTGSIAKLSGDTSSVMPLGTSFTNFSTSIGSAVPGIQALVAADPSAPALAARASDLGFTQLANFL